MAKNTGTAITKDDSPSALSRDMLEGLDLDLTGLEEADASDFKLASLVFNFGGLDKKTNEQIPKNVFFHTIDETQKRKVRVALLVLHKSNGWSEFVQGEGTKHRCRSWDRVTGTMEDGTTRPCAGCPDAEWKTIGGKRTRNCTEIANVVGEDLETNQPVMLRFKKTSIGPWKKYLNQYFLLRRIVNGKRTNYPLFAFETNISLVLEKNGANAYAVPVFERGAVLPREEVVRLAESARAFKDVYLNREVRELAEHDDVVEQGDAPDTSFDFGANSAEARDVDPSAFGGGD
jgi:hypothetical protein